MSNFSGFADRANTVSPDIMLYKHEFFGGNPPCADGVVHLLGPGAGTLKGGVHVANQSVKFDRN